MSNLLACVADAMNVIRKGQSPSFAKSDYENALDDLAKSGRRDHETHEAAVSRLLDESEDARALYTAAYDSETASITKRLAG